MNCDSFILSNENIARVNIDKEILEIGDFTNRIILPELKTNKRIEIKERT